MVSPLLAPLTLTEAMGLLSAVLQRIMGLVENHEDHWLLGGHLTLLAFWLKDCPDSAGELLRNGAGFQFVCLRCFFR